MKTTFLRLQKILLSTLPLFCMMQVLAQPKPRVAVLTIDAKGFSLDASQMGNLVRMELEKLDRFEVMDRYDVSFLSAKNKLNIADCYGKLCMMEIGKVLEADKMMSGSMEMFGEKIVITLRLVDVHAGVVEKSQVREFLDLQNEVQSMVAITLHDMFGLPNEESMVNRLSKKFTYESSTTNPETERLKLTGPRMGLTMVAGDAYKRMLEPKHAGGFDAFPLMTQFGYQFETQYLNEGNFQALFEFVPTVTGIDQGFFIPSFTLLHGLRNSKSGIEFAFGPSIGLARMGEGFYSNGKWELVEEWEKENPGTKAPESTIMRPDSRGTPTLVSGFVLAVGKTFKSGKLNIPVNAYVIPDKESWRVGLSFGFNAKNKSRAQQVPPPVEG